MSIYTDASLIVTPNAYKAGKLYSLKPTDGTGDLDVVRNTTATRVNSDGLIETVGVNVPRLDYSNGSCPSILVEPQSTNVLLNSETVATQTIVVTAQSYTISFYGTGTITLSGAHSFAVIGTGTTRKTYTFTATAGALILTITGTVTKGQLEAGSYPTSYIPTVASTVTRNADMISKTGISSLIGVNVGTFYFQVGFVQTSGIGQPVWNELKSINGSIFCYDDSVFHSIGGGFNFISNISPFDKVAIIWNGLNITTYQNGLLISTIAQSSIFNPNEYALGTNYNLISITKNKGTQIYKTALTDAELIALTTI